MTSVSVVLGVCLFVRGSGWLDVGRGLRSHGEPGGSQIEAEGPEPARIPPLPDQEPPNRQADSPGRGPGHTRSDSREDGPELRPAVARSSRARSSRMSVALQDLRNTVSPRAHTHTPQHARSPCAAAGPACSSEAEWLSVTRIDLCARASACGLKSLLTSRINQIDVVIRSEDGSGEAACSSWFCWKFSGPGSGSDPVWKNPVEDLLDQVWTSQVQSGVFTS